MANTGHPGSSGWAQSGGINHTFGGGKGGTPQSKPSTQGKKLGGGTLNNGLHYTTRSEAGDKSLVSQRFKVGSPPPVHPGGKGVTATKKVTIKPPAYKGGSEGRNKNYGSK